MLGSGYTAYAVRMLKAPRVVFIDGSPKAIGGRRALTEATKKDA